MAKNKKVKIIYNLFFDLSLLLLLLFGTRDFKIQKKLVKFIMFHLFVHEMVVLCKVMQYDPSVFFEFSTFEFKICTVHTAYFSNKNHCIIFFPTQHNTPLHMPMSRQSFILHFV